MKDNTMNFKFCPFCGEQLQLKQKGHRKRMYCSRCKWTHYKNPTVGVAVIVLKDNDLLLVKRNSSYKTSKRRPEKKCFFDTSCFQLLSFRNGLNALYKVP